jgi:diacylglycerol kinase (ATP)
MDPLLVITNSAAGTAEDDSLKAALDALRSECSVEVSSTQNPGELDGVLHRAGSRRLVIAGGDGSLHAVISALHRRNELKGRTLGLLPLGTGNDFARANAIPLDPVEAARVVCAGHACDRDLLVDEVGEVVVNSVHAGASTQASRHGARWKDRLHAIGLGPVNLGKLGYPLGALLSAFRPAEIRLRVEVDGETVADVDEPILMVAVGNGSQVGGGLEVTPHAEPGDGLIDVMIARATGPLARVGYGADLVRGRHPARNDVSYLRGEVVSVSGEKFWCSADGEIYGPERSRTWHVESAAYSLVVPA